MRNGKFFSLDMAYSDIGKGIILFNYTGLSSYDDIYEGAMMLPKYPIRLVITSTSVKFILHYSTYRRDCEKEKVVKYGFESDSPELGVDKKEVLSITHIEETIVELPFLGMGSEDLTSIIGRLYYSEFPRENTNDISYGNRFLLERIKKQYNRKDGAKIFATDQQGNSVSVVGHYHIHSYSSLDCCGLDGEWKTQPVFDDKERCVGFLRKLLLDFMFDLAHSDVFQNSSGFQAMYSGLMSNFYFSSLLHKYDYYFYRQLLWDELSSQDKPSDSNKSIEKSRPLDLYKGYKRHAENLWVRDILNPEAEMSFRNSNDKPEWFSDPEAEMRHICFPERNNSTKTKDIQTRKQRLFDFNKDRRKKIEQICPEKANRSNISQWFLKRYDFQDTIRFHQPSWLLWGSGPLVVSITFILAVLFIIPLICAELPIYLFLIILFLLFLIAVSKMIKGTLADNLHVFLPRLVAAIATGWITMAVGFDLFAAFFDFNATSRPYNIVYVLGTVAILVVFIVNRINQSAPRLKQGKKVLRAGILVLFGFIICMFVGITIVDFLGERYIARGCDADMFFTEFNDKHFSYEGINRDRLFYDGDVDSLKASREEIVNGLTTTFHVREDGKVLHNHPVVVKVDVPNDKHRLFSFFYLRDFTVIFSFIALFVGIFINLIFADDKKITEV